MSGVVLLNLGNELKLRFVIGLLLVACVSVGCGNSEDDWIAKYEGTWFGHGQALAVDSNGKGILAHRTYISCDETPSIQNAGVPCEPKFGVLAGRAHIRLARSDKFIILSVVDSNDVGIKGNWNVKFVGKELHLTQKESDREFIMERQLGVVPNGWKTGG